MKVNLVVFSIGIMFYCLIASFEVDSKNDMELFTWKKVEDGPAHPMERYDGSELHDLTVNVKTSEVSLPSVKERFEIYSNSPRHHYDIDSYSKDTLSQLAPSRLLPLPETYSFDFEESFTESTKSISGKGRWVYDWANRRGLVYHSMGSRKFCSRNDHTQQACAELYQPDGMWVLYKNNTCCKLCDANDGCGLLEPDFLSDNEEIIYQGAKEIEGKTCHGYSRVKRTGSQMWIDSWWIAEDGYTPCSFNEELKQKATKFSYEFIVMSKTFTEKVDKRELQLPAVCRKTCPTTWSWYSMRIFE